MIKELLSKIKEFYFPHKIEATKMNLALAFPPILGTSVTLTATVTDDNHQPLIGQTVTFTGDNGVTVDPVGITDANGQVSVQASANIGVSVASVIATTADGAIVSAFLVFPVLDAPKSRASDVPAVQPSELEKFKTRVAAIVAFVEHGVEVFGKDAEAELLAFKDKYL